jgi:hypothetical protein
MLLDKPEVRERLRELKNKRVERNTYLIPASIPYLEELAAISLGDELLAVLREIAFQYARIDLHILELAALRRMIPLMHGTNDVGRWIELAIALSYHKEAFDDTLQVLKASQLFAEKKNEFISWAYIAQASIARRLNDSDLFSSALKALITIESTSREVDIEFQRDIVEGLSKDFCDVSLINAYLDKAPK